MITRIGIIADDIWNILEEKDDILMSIGWLAREGHITLDKLGEDFQISLRKRK